MFCEATGAKLCEITEDDGLIKIKISGEVINVVKLAKIVSLVAEKNGSKTLNALNGEVLAGEIEIHGNEDELLKVCMVLEELKKRT